MDKWQRFSLGEGNYKENFYVALNMLWKVFMSWYILLLSSSTSPCLLYSCTQYCYCTTVLSTVKYCTCTGEARDVTCVRSSSTRHQHTKHIHVHPCLLTLWKMFAFVSWATGSAVTPIAWKCWEKPPLKSQAVVTIVTSRRFELKRHLWCCKWKVCMYFRGESSNVVLDCDTLC